MIHLLRQRAYPAMGKEREVRKFLTEWVQHVQGQGRRLSLLQQLFSSEGPSLVVTTRAESLEELNQLRMASAADADFQERAAHLMTLCRAPVTTLVSQSIVPFQSPAATQAGALVTTVAVFPALGREAEVREYASRYVRESQERGIQQALARRLFSSVGPVLELFTIWESAAAYEESQEQNAERNGEAVRIIHGMSRAPFESRVLEILVPLRG
jgi:hypothetical protein